MDNFKASLVRGTTAQAKANPNKAIFLADQLASLGVESLRELTYEQNVTINVAIAGIDAKPYVKTNDDWIGQAIERERARGKNSGFD